MAKARLVRRALEKAGWRLVSIESSHRKYTRSGKVEMFAYHDHVDLGGPAVARVAKRFGLTVEALRRLL
jgi:predicted RNA binding protein YcfA (HicA-like mRNA interferase family)